MLKVSFALKYSSVGTLLNGADCWFAKDVLLMGVGWSLCCSCSTTGLRMCFHDCAMITDVSCEGDRDFSIFRNLKSSSLLKQRMYC